MRLWFAVGVLAVVSYATVLALDFPAGSRLFPLVIGIPTAVLALVEVVRQVMRRRRTPGQVDPPADGTPAVAMVPMTWTYAFITAAFFFGVKWAAPLFIVLYLRFMVRWSVFKSLIPAVAYYFVITTLSSALGLRIPPGWWYR